MQTARVTILMTPEKKAAIESDALRMGVSSGEYIRLAVDNFSADAEAEEELRLLAQELSAAVPAMRASLDRSIETLQNTHREMDAFLRAQGIRK